jgi:hypothetical protein
MNIQFQDQIPSEFSDNSRVWVYQCNRIFTLSEALEIEELLEKFNKEWNSHGDEVNSFVNLFFGQFIIGSSSNSSSEPAIFYRNNPLVQ